MNMPTITHNDKPSTTAWMVLIAFILVQVRFMLPEAAGYGIMSGVEYGAAMAAVGAIHVIRENGRG